MTELERKFTRDMEELCWITKKRGTTNINGI